MNLGKLVPLEVHDRLENAKIRTFQQTKETQIGYLVKKIQPWEISKLKVANSREEGPCRGL